jgi:GntR family transcriptional regulator
MTDIIGPTDELSLRIGGLPLPDLVADALRKAIANGKLKSGQRLPAEPLLAEQLGVSRATLRQAVSLLTQEGLLIRQHGRGTFVSALPTSVLRGNLTELMSTSQMIREQGYQPGMTGCRVELTNVEQRIADMFDIPANTRFLHISRTRLANSHPAVYSDEFIPESLFGPDVMPREGTTEDWSLYEKLQKAGVDVAFATCKVIPTVATEALASHLGIPVGHPLLLLKQLHYTGMGQPVLYCENYHNCDFIEFQTLRKS